MDAAPRLTVRGLRARAVDVPLRRPHPTAGGTVASAPLVLLDLDTEEGVTGHAYLFCYAALALAPVVRLLASLEDLVKGEPAAPLTLERKLRARFRLLGAQGLAGMALGGIDMAAWDALARAAGLPLATLLGGEPRPVPAYHSLGMGGAATAAAEAEEAAVAGFTAVKLKIGYPEVAGDVEALRAARRAGGGRVAVMVDYNQSLTVPEAVARGRALAAEGPAWIEEPVTAEDLAGHARVARELETPVQTGENWWAPRDLARAIEAQASDLAMLDVMKIGGVTGWLRAAALAEAHGLPVSSHLFPEISAQLLAVTPTAHWLEYQDWASPVLREPLRVERGTALPSDRPGTGIEWDEAAVRRYLVG